MNTPPIVLAAEDDENDAFILRLAFEEANISQPLTILPDGLAAVDYLSGVPPFNDRVAHPLPALLTLDLKMPRMNGFDVLAWLQTRPEFRDLPVVVFSSSSEPADMERARRLGARDYFVKPHRMEDFIEILHNWRDRWLTPASHLVRSA